LQILELTELLTKNLWKIEYFGITGKEKKPANLLICRLLMLFVISSSDPAGIRTQDPYIKSVLLYQLSYGIVFATFFINWICTGRFRNCDAKVEFKKV
jgi:hypothetical protein